MLLSKPYIFLTFLLTSLVFNSYSQNKNVGIGTDNPHPSAFVHVESDGVLSPNGVRIPYTDTNAIQAYANSFTPPIPIANGLLIFQKGAETFFYYDAPKNKWIALSGITGPTGAKGATGPTGPTGPRGYGTKVLYGNGPPVSKPSDTCGYYYIDMVNALIYKFNCPGGWGSMPLAGSFKNNIFGGETVHVTSTIQTIVSGVGTSSSPMKPIPGLNYTITAPPGYRAFCWIKAWGSVRKTQVNNEYNYAKFDFYVGTPPIAQLKWQTVSMGPTGPGPDFHQELVKWSISKALEVSGSKRIEVYGQQKVLTKTGLGPVILAGAPGDPEEAHLEIMMIYVKD